MVRRRKTQGASVPTGLPYGTGAKLQEAQRALPLPGPGSSPQPSAPAPSSPAGGAPVPAPVQDPMLAAIAAAQAMPAPAGGFAGPSRRQGEPVTAGMSIGAGAGPSALPVPAFDADDDTLLDLINAYRLAPSPGLRRLIEIARNRVGVQHATRDAGRAARRPKY